MSEAAQKFEPIPDTEAPTFLREASKSIAPTMLWTKLQEKVIHTYVLLVDEKTNDMILALPDDLDQRKFVEEIARSGKRDCFFSISLSRANLFFHATFLGYESGIRFKIPDQMFKVLRRNDLRFEIPDSFKIKVTFTDPAANSLTMTKNLIDVSRTGIGILVNTQEAGLLSKGLILENIEFSIQGYKIKCRAEVKHVSQHKVGLCFKDIDPAHSRFLGEYATKESRTLFQQMIKD